MGNKNKTISFRVNEEKFEALRDIAEERDISLSSVFRDYVDKLVDHDGQVQVVPEHVGADEDEDVAFPPKVTVSKSYVREHERLELEADRLELEAEHLREQLDEYKRFARHLQDKLDEDVSDDVVYLEDIDGDDGEETFSLETLEDA